MGTQEDTVRNMDLRAETARWEKLVGYLRPLHEQAVATARRLSRSTHDGDDLYQETVLRAYDKLDDLRDESRFRSWFFAILLSRHRSRARRPRRDTTPLDSARELPDERRGKDGTLWDEERRGAERAARALAGLEPDQREAIVLHDLEGFSVEEVAGLQGVSVSAVKSRLSRGREKLRRFYLRHERAGEAPLGPLTAGAKAGKGEIP
jgi:RNA polymerase sigma-70 factor (ECF subfamily)